MTPQAYLTQVLQSQELRAQDMNLVQTTRDVLHTHLSRDLGGTPRIYYGGSYGKDTMIRDAFDLDLVVYFPHTDRRPLDELFGAVHRSLVKTRLKVYPQTVALRLPGEGGFHVDVVPARAHDDTYRYATLHRNTQPPSTLQTSLKVHIEAVRGIRQIVRVLKLWRLRNAVPLKTFALEILAARGLDGLPKDDLAVAVVNVLRFIATQMETVRLVDPANSNNVLEVTANDRRAAAKIATASLGATWGQVVW